MSSWRNASEDIDDGEAGVNEQDEHDGVYSVSLSRDKEKAASLPSLRSKLVFPCSLCSREKRVSLKALRSHG